jgi:hypothetical protein
MRATTRIRRLLLGWQARDYVIRATEPVSAVVVPGDCWIVTGRHGATMVSRTLAIWDVDDIDPVAEDWTVLATIQLRLAQGPGTNPEGFRVYRTAAGARVIWAHDPLDWDAEEGDTLTDRAWFFLVSAALRADPIYETLCHRQRTCRARLHPKPSRLGRFQRPQVRACRFIGGDQRVDPVLAAQVEFHDRETGALDERDLPLA